MTKHHHCRHFIGMKLAEVELRSRMAAENGTDPRGRLSGHR